MRYKKFKIKSYDSDKWFWVRIYDNLKDMQKGAEAYDKYLGKKFMDFSDTLGLCTPYTRLRINEDGTETDIGNIGIIWFCKKHLATMIVAHEVVHAALWNYRLEHKDVANFGKQCGKNEEEYAHLYGQLFRDCINKLYKKGYW